MAITTASGKWCGTASLSSTSSPSSSSNSFGVRRRGGGRGGCEPLRPPRAGFRQPHGAAANDGAGSSTCG
jgi:hypothetical protein